MKKELTDFQKRTLQNLKRRRKVLEDNKELALKNLQPILNDLEEIRLKIDSIELD